MRIGVMKSLITILILTGMAVPALAESLFVTGISQEYYVEPKPLFGSVRARAVGDIVTVVLDEDIALEDDIKYDMDKSSSTTDNFSTLLNKILPGKPINDVFNGYGGANTVANTAKTYRNLSVKDYVTVQVVQVLPNGNLMIQGKKTLINSNERVDLIMSGIIDPRWIDYMGQVKSRNVANLQFAVSGKGTVSRANNEGVVNRLIRYMF